jgi:hypothetical protein
VIEKFLWLLLAHYVADYPLQGDFLAQTKGEYWYSLLAHSIIYGLSVALALNILGVFAVWKAILLVSSHFIIDYKKSNAINKKKSLSTYLYADQILHIAINTVLAVV